MSDSDSFPFAAVVYQPEHRVEDLLRHFAEQLKAQGVRVGGVIQRSELANPQDDPCAMALQDLRSGESFSLSQALGKGSEACRLDPDALARAAVSVRQAVEAGVQLVMVNKFGAQEANGAGLREELALAVTSGVPLLTTVAERLLPQWREFTGGEGAELPPTAAALQAWWKSLA